MSRERQYPLGARLTLDELNADPHPALARLRGAEPVSWVPSLGGWLVTRHDLAVAVMGDAGTFTVNDPRFSTAQVIGPSMLSLDGEEHVHHRLPFVRPFRSGPVGEGLSGSVSDHVDGLIAALEPLGHMELRRQFAGPLSAAVIAHALGLDDDVADLLRDYDAIVTSVDSITAGRGPTEEGAAAFAALRNRLGPVIASRNGRSLLASAAARADTENTLSPDQVAANAAVLLFGGIETTEGMIANAALELLRRPGLLEHVRDHPPALDAAVDESLRLEPAAAVVDRYATADCVLGGAEISPGELVRVSIAGANRDPAVFIDPDLFDSSRPNLRRHLAFAQGPHVCLGVHLARLEARVALRALTERLPGLQLDPQAPAKVRGLVFRKPQRLEVIWG